MKFPSFAQINKKPGFSRLFVLLCFYVALALSRIKLCFNMGSVGPIRADIAQVVEHFHGKKKVASASLAVGSNGMNIARP